VAEPINPFQPISREKAQRIADRRNARRRKALPLFAADLEEVTAEQVQEEFRRQHEQFQRCLDQLAERAARFRAVVAELVTNEELAALDERRACLPSGPEYSADFWRRQLSLLKGGDVE
jgi:hypothetical protein